MEGAFVHQRWQHSGLAFAFIRAFEILLRTFGCLIAAGTVSDRGMCCTSAPWVLLCRVRCSGFKAAGMMCILLGKSCQGNPASGVEVHIQPL